MIPIEWVAILLWIICGIVGFARRFPVELGATIGFTAMLLMIDLGGGKLSEVAYEMLTAIGFTLDKSLAQWWIFTGLITVWVVFMYAGQTLSFQGVWPPSRIVGTAIDIMTGLFNGWIIVGTWWFITDNLGYPIEKLGLYVPPLSPTAERLVSYTPPALLPDGYSTLIIGGFLILLIALRVFR